MADNANLITGDIALTGQSTIQFTNRKEDYSNLAHGVISLTGFAFTVTGDNVYSNLETGGLSFTGNAPSFIDTDFVILETGSVTLTGNPPNFVDTDFVTLITGSLSLTGNAITAIANYTQETVAYCVNLRTGAHSTYEGFEFNSLSGNYGAKADGIYLLEGSTDTGLEIACLLDIGKTDFQDPHLKRMTDMYLGASSDGDIQLELITENADSTYTITGSAALQTNQIGLSRGAEGRYWQPILSNVNGSSFVVEDIELSAEFLQRKSRGTAAQVTVVNPTPELGTCCNDVEMAFSWGDATPAKIVTVPAGKTVFKIQVVLQTVFNGSVIGLTIGDSADHDRLLGANDISLVDVATYEVNPNYLYTAQTDVNLYITVDNSNTQGNGVILLELKD